jgi:hypothetical protein
MDMLMTSESSVEAIAKNFLSGNYNLTDDLLQNVNINPETDVANSDQASP